LKTTVLGGLLLLGSVSCDAVLGVEPYPGSVFREAPCAACMESACGAQVDACFLEGACVDFVACQGRCAPDDFACRAACDATQASALSEPAVREVDACRRSACLAECLGTELPPAYPEDACRSCVLAIPECLDARAACLAAADCERYTLCSLAAEDPAAILECNARYLPPIDLPPDSEEAWDFAWERCARVDCHDDCGVGTRWDCAGVWSEVPVPTGALIPLTIRATALFEDDAPLANVTVEVCEQFVSSDTGCVPIEELTVLTDDDGVAELSVPSTSGEGFVSHLRLSREATADLSEVEPNLFKVGAPITRPTTLGVGVMQSLERAAIGLAACDPDVPPLDPSLGGVSLYALDCKLENGVCATVTLIDAEDRPCTSAACGFEASKTAACYLNGGEPCTGISTGTGMINVVPGLRDFQIAVGGSAVATLRGVPVVGGVSTHVLFFPDRR
jgi:hypothetical protein